MAIKYEREVMFLLQYIRRPTKNSFHFKFDIRLGLLQVTISQNTIFNNALQPDCNVLCIMHSYLLTVFSTTISILLKLLLCASMSSTYADTMKCIVWEFLLANTHIHRQTLKYLIKGIYIQSKNDMKSIFEMILLVKHTF